MKFIALFLCVVISACGFKPVYKKDSSIGNNIEELKKIDILLPNHNPGSARYAQILKNSLSNLLNPEDENFENKYILKMELKIKSSALLIESTRQVNRYNLTISNKYSLTEKSSGKIVTSGKSDVTGSYDVVESDYANYVAEKDTIERSMNEMARDLKYRLSAHFIK